MSTPQGQKEILQQKIMNVKESYQSSIAEEKKKKIVSWIILLIICIIIIIILLIIMYTTTPGNRIFYHCKTGLIVMGVLAGIIVVLLIWVSLR
jgi:lipopolysaccharide/colanic/teichoic acid biosynthesis glycosyltransferase